MQASKQSEPNLVVWNVRLRGRLAPFSALVAVCAFVPLLAGSASPAAGARNVVLAAGAPAVVPSDAPAQTTASDAAGGVTGLGGGPMAFPDLALPTLPGRADPAGIPGVVGVVLAGPIGPVYGSTLLTGSIEQGRAGFIRPVNAPELSGFGPRIHPVLGRPMFHTGIDLGAACATPIRAAADGTVVYAAKSPSWGNRIIIAHSPTLKTAYGHQSRMIAKAGDEVKQGQVIGLVGTTGWSTGCHLHFDVIVNNQYVDPAPYLGLAGGSAAAVPFFSPGPGSPGDTGGSPVVKNPNPPVPDGDVPIKAATTKKPVKRPANAGTTKPTRTARPSTTKPTATSTTPRPSTTTTPPPATTPATTTPAPTGTSGPPSSSSTTTTTTPPTTTTTSPPTSTTSTATSTSSGSASSSSTTSSGTSTTSSASSASSGQTEPQAAASCPAPDPDLDPKADLPPKKDADPKLDVECTDPSVPLRSVDPEHAAAGDDIPASSPAVGPPTD